MYSKKLFLGTSTFLTRKTKSKHIQKIQNASSEKNALFLPVKNILSWNVLSFSSSFLGLWKSLLCTENLRLACFTALCFSQNIFSEAHCYNACLNYFCSLSYLLSRKGFTMDSGYPFASFSLFTTFLNSSCCLSDCHCHGTERLLKVKVATRY